MGNNYGNCAKTRERSLDRAQSVRHRQRVMSRRRQAAASSGSLLIIILVVGLEGVLTAMTRL
ncbi:unnamed protein product [Brassica oleracea var. botrytis]